MMAKTTGIEWASSSWNSWMGWVTGCDSWEDSDKRDLDSYYTYGRFDVDVLVDLPCGRCGGQ